jgi:3-hydroxyacyl-CoA dehydrogenase/enoyl-CoA hydratase/3-hydroxybutyryl-CoA epimerase
VETIRVSVDGEGIAALVVDVPDAPLNALSDAWVAECEAALTDLLARGGVRGLVVTSAKQCFAAGWNLKDLLALFARSGTPAQIAAATPGFSRFLRRLETCGLPVAAAINGFALGGGLELALACHHRVLASEPGSVVGLPEVTVGLLPGAGGTQRLPRLIGAAKALPLLVEGKSVPPQEALALGIVHELAPATEVVARARAWLLGTPVATQPWDRKGFSVPGGATLASDEFANLLMLTSPSVDKATLGNYPAPSKILAAVFEGLALPLDRGLEIERQLFAELAAGPVARNLIRTMFVNKGKADKLARRPQNVAKRPVTKLGVLGAGMMGAGLAYVAARRGIHVALLDTSDANAAKGRDYAAKALARERDKGRMDAAEAEAVLARIEPTTDYARLDGSELVIEAVFENRAIKAEVTRRAEARLDERAVFATNTSTLPITGLAEASLRPERFIGMHFFSPVERMPLVEIIRGRRTGDEALAHALDLAKQLGKTPIVVNDSRGFYTSRVFATYIYEGQMLLQEGVAPALIENAGRFAGMPVGPLAVMDEVSLELQYHVVQQTKADLGAAFEYPPCWNVLRHMVEDLRRLGRKAGGGFYEYPAGTKKHLWPGLATEFPPVARQPSLDAVKERLLTIQALESVRCLEEGVLTHAADGDLGSILGWGFPSWTGGTLSYVDTVGVREFVARCLRLAEECGPRFAPPSGLVERARSGVAFHEAA